MSGPEHSSRRRGGACARARGAARCGAPRRGGSAPAPSAIARQAAGLTAIPQWLARDLDCSSALGIEAGAPVDDAVAARVDRDEARRPRAAARRASLQKSAQHSPSRQERLNSPGAPSEPSRPTASTCRRTSGWTASGSSCGRAERDDAADQVGAARGEHLGEAAAAALADRRPPAGPARRRSARGAAPAARTSAPEQSTLARMPALAWCGSRPAAASRPSARASRRRPGSPGSAAPGGRGRRSAPRRAEPGRAAAPRLEAEAGLPPERRPGAADTDDGCLHGDYNLVTRTAGFRSRQLHCAVHDRFPAVRARDHPGRQSSSSSERPDPEPGPRRAARARARRPGSTAPTCSSSRGGYPAPPGSPPTSRGSS